MARTAPFKEAKAPKPSKAPSRAFAKSTSKATGASASTDAKRWLVRDDRQLLSLAATEAATLAAVAQELGRQPWAVAQRFMELGGPAEVVASTSAAVARSKAAQLAPADATLPMPPRPHWLDDEPMELGFEPGSEEAREFLALVLSGVPLPAASRWCLVATERPTQAQIADWTTAGGGDLRAAFELASDLGLWIHEEAQLRGMRFLMGESRQKVVQARDVLRERFDAPTPNAIAQILLGVPLARERAYHWAERNVMPVFGEVVFTTKAGKAKSKAKGSGKSSSSSTKASGKRSSSGVSASKGASYKRSKSRSGSSAAQRRYWAQRRAKESSGGGKYQGSKSSSGGGRRSKVEPLSQELLQSKDPGWEKRSWGKHVFL